jgi:alpha-beta hydrolase superfamily lysophospholipase
LDILAIKLRKMSGEELNYNPFQNSFKEIPDYVEQNWLPLLSPDGTQLYTYRVRSAKPKALLFYFHGYLSYSLEYIHLGYEMAKEGFDVFSLDHRGHGHSGGYLGYFDDLDHLVYDAVLYVNQVKEIYGDLPVILSGTSMGGAITVNAAQRLDVKGMVLFAPAFGLYEELNCCLSGLLACFACFCPRAVLPNIQARPLSRNLDAIEALKAGGRCSFDRVRAQSIKTLVDGIEKTYRKARIIRTPFVLVQGGCDYITSEPKAHRFYMSAASSDKEYWFYPEMHHCVQLEPEFDEILARLKIWIAKRLS